MHGCSDLVVLCTWVGEVAVVAAAPVCGESGEDGPTRFECMMMI